MVPMGMGAIEVKVKWVTNGAGAVVVGGGRGGGVVGGVVGGAVRSLGGAVLATGAVLGAGRLGSGVGLVGVGEGVVGVGDGVVGVGDGVVGVGDGVVGVGVGVTTVPLSTVNVELRWVTAVPACTSTESTWLPSATPEVAHGRAVALVAPVLTKSHGAVFSTWRGAWARAGSSR